MRYTTECVQSLCSNEIAFRINIMIHFFMHSLYVIFLFVIHVHIHAYSFHMKYEWLQFFVVLIIWWYDITYTHLYSIMKFYHLFFMNYKHTRKQYTCVFINKVIWVRSCIVLLSIIHYCYYYYSYIIRISHLSASLNEHLSISFLSQNFFLRHM